MALKHGDSPGEKDDPCAAEADAIGTRSAELMEWACVNLPGFLEGIDENCLQPDKYEEHRVICEFMRLRERIAQIIRRS
jgi:hypothetical protein